MSKPQQISYLDGLKIFGFQTDDCRRKEEEFLSQPVAAAEMSAAMRTDNHPRTRIDDTPILRPRNL